MEARGPLFLRKKIIIIYIYIERERESERERERERYIFYNFIFRPSFSKKKNYLGPFPYNFTSISL